MLNLLPMREPPARDTLGGVCASELAPGKGRIPILLRPRTLSGYREMTMLREPNSSNATPRMLYDLATPFFIHVIVYAAPAA